MILVGAATCLGVVDVVLPVWLRLALQMIIGTFAGYRLDQEAAQRIRKMGRPVLVVTVWTIGSALLIGYLLGILTGLDWPTAFLGTAPGSLPEMSAMALTMQANVAMVATLSSARLITTMLSIPFLARRSANNEKAAQPAALWRTAAQRHHLPPPPPSRAPRAVCTGPPVWPLVLQAGACSRGCNCQPPASWGPSWL